jgi:hypothetical protein
VQALAPL